MSIEVEGGESAGCEDDNMPRSVSSRVSDDDAQEVDHHLKSILLFVDVMARYNDRVSKLKPNLVALDMEDHLWRLQSYDLNGVGVVQLLCIEYNKQFGGVEGIILRWLYTTFSHISRSNTSRPTSIS